MKLEGVDFIGNTITNSRTNDDLDLRASGTGVVRVGSNTNIDRRFNSKWHNNI